MSETSKSVLIIGGAALALFLLTRRNTYPTYYSPPVQAPNSDAASMAARFGIGMLNQGGQVAGQVLSSFFGGGNGPTEDIGQY